MSGIGASCEIRGGATGTLVIDDAPLAAMKNTTRFIHKTLDLIGTGFFHHPA